MGAFLHPSRASAPNPALGFADLGQYFVATNPTPGTALNTIAALSALADTSPFISLLAGAKTIYLDYLKLTCAAGGTGGTQLRYATKTDSPKAQATAGTTCTPVNTHQGLGTLAATTGVVAGPLVGAAAVAPRLAGHALLKNAIPAPGDVYLIKYGGVDYGINSAATFVYAAAPPVVVDPTMIAQLHIWLPGQTVLSSWEFELGFWEV